MSKKGLNIYKRKDGRWEGRYIRSYNESGKAKYGYIYGKTYNDVKQRLLEKKSCLNHSEESFKKSSKSYNDILDAWLQFKRINIKESTYARYLYLINSHIRPYLGKYLLSNMNVQLIENFIERKLYNGRLDHNGGLSAKTVTDILTIIKSTLEYAQEHNYMVSCNLNKLIIKKKDKKIRVLSKQEQEALVKVLMTDMDLYKFGVLLSLYTGIRIGELCALKWDNFNITNSILKVRKTLQRIQETSFEASNKTKVIITDPKSDCSIRDIPLPVFLIDIAKQYIGNCDDFILSGKSNKFVEPRTMQNRFNTYIVASGINKANFHSLRHTFATRCIEVGFDIKSLSEILGHSNVNITLNRYVHSSLELKHSNMNKLTLI